jgi:NADH-quinone oxidoreductase subunit C
MVDAQSVQQSTGAELVESTFRDNRRWVVAAEHIYAVLRHLRDVHGFDMLVDITAVDYLESADAADRYGVVYPLLNTATGERLIVKTFVNDPTRCRRTPCSAPTGWSGKSTTCSASGSGVILIRDGF